MEKEIKKKYPDETGVRKAAPNPVSRVDKGNTNRSRSGADSFQMTEQETQMMKTFVRDGVMTKEQYIAELKKMNG